MAKPTKAIKKKQQIDKAHHNMFVVVAGAAFLTGFAIVAAVFMFNKILFNNRVLAEKNNTFSVLENNNKNLVSLAEEVRALQANDDLRSVRIGDGDNLRVVLDALPAIGNSNALGASLKDKILAVPGVTIETISVTSTPDETDIPLEPESDQGLTDGESEITSSPIYFTFKLSGNVADLSQALKNVERSIRPIILDSVTLEVSSTDGQSNLVAVGHSFYEPLLEVKLGKKILENKK